MNINVNKKGSVTALTLLIAVVLTITGVASLGLAYQARLKTIREIRKMSARVAADAGLTKALYIMNQNEWDDDSLPLVANEAMPNWDATFSYSVTGDSASGYTISATGTYGLSQKTVQAKLQSDNYPFKFAIFGDRQVDFKSSSEVGKINGSSSNKPAIGTNSESSASIKIYNNAVIDGDIYVGPQGDPSYVIWKLANPTGVEEALSSAIDLKVISAPSYLRSQSSGGDIKNNTTLETSGKYNKVDLGKNEKLTINGDIELYLTGSLILGNKASLEILEDSSLILYIDGNIEGKNGSNFINKTDDASKFQVFGGNFSKTYRFKNKRAFYGAIYAPKAKVYLYNSASSCGSVICDQYEQKNSSKFYYDENLASVKGSSDSGQYEIAEWQEF